jgi:5-methyltetrahydrofolate--homocysteine methyltransferase
LDQATLHPRPNKPGIHVFENYPLGELVHYIDWSPFFHAWELAGKFPQILDDPTVGQTATNLYHDAQAMLNCIVREQWLTANGVIGLFPAQAVGDDILVYDEAGSPLTTIHCLRQQMERPPGRPNFSLADFIAPQESGVQTTTSACLPSRPDWALRSGWLQFEADHDDYNAILLKALADRLAEAFAERLHQRVRQEFWGYADEESCANEDLIAERYRGIRPAPGYPACPDHTEKPELFRVLDAPCRAGMTLTESCAMRPAASVSGYYFSHPQSQYFGIGRIDRDQIADYAARKGWDVETAERWLAPVLGILTPETGFLAKTRFLTMRYSTR